MINRPRGRPPGRPAACAAWLLREWCTDSIFSRLGEVTPGPLLRALQKNQPSPVVSQARRLPPAESFFLSCRMLAPPLGDAAPWIPGPRTAAQGMGPGRGSMPPAVHLSGVAKPLPPCPREQLSGRTGQEGLRATAINFLCCQPDFIRKLPSWWETVVPQFDLSKDCSCLMLFLLERHREHVL